MGFILLIVFILTIFRTWKQSPLYGRFASHTPLRQLADFAPTTHAKNLMPISMINVQ